MSRLQVRRWIIYQFLDLDEEVEMIKQMRILAAILLVGGSIGMAEASSTNSKLTKMLFFESGNLIYVYPSGGISGAPGCASGKAFYTFSATRPMAKIYIAGLMMAYAEGKRVFIKGKGVCTDQASSETLSWFLVSD